MWKYLELLLATDLISDIKPKSIKKTKTFKNTTHVCILALIPAALCKNKKYTKYWAK